MATESNQTLHEHSETKGTKEREELTITQPPHVALACRHLTLCLETQTRLTSSIGYFLATYPPILQSFSCMGPGGVLKYTREAGMSSTFNLAHLPNLAPLVFPSVRLPAFLEQV